MNHMFITIHYAYSNFSPTLFLRFTLQSTLARQLLLLAPWSLLGRYDCVRTLSSCLCSKPWHHSLRHTHNWVVLMDCLYSGMHCITPDITSQFSVIVLPFPLNDERKVQYSRHLYMLHSTKLKNAFAFFTFLVDCPPS